MITAFVAGVLFTLCVIIIINDGDDSNPKGA